MKYIHVKYSIKLTKISAVIYTTFNDYPEKELKVTHANMHICACKIANIKVLHRLMSDFCAHKVKDNRYSFLSKQFFRWLSGRFFLFCRTIPLPLQKASLRYVHNKHNAILLQHCAFSYPSCHLNFTRWLTMMHMLWFDFFSLNFWN